MLSEPSAHAPARPKISPGSEGESLSCGVCVFRIAKDRELSPEAKRQHRAIPQLFEPSTEDKKSPGKRLSIWVEELAIPDQAWGIMGSKPENTVVACLNVDDVRSVIPPEGFAQLDVEWEQAMHEGLPDTRPGSKGHVGIVGLIQGGNGKGDSNKRKQLRLKLADKARISPVPVPHDIPLEHLQIAAYFISQNAWFETNSQEDDWINAVRQLRRERVRAYAATVLETDPDFSLSFRAPSSASVMANIELTATGISTESG